MNKYNERPSEGSCENQTMLQAAGDEMVWFELKRVRKRLQLSQPPAQITLIHRIRISVSRILSACQRTAFLYRSDVCESVLIDKKQAVAILPKLANLV